MLDRTRQLERPRRRTSNSALSARPPRPTPRTTPRPTIASLHRDSHLAPFPYTDQLEPHGDGARQARASGVGSSSSSSGRTRPGLSMLTASEAGSSVAEGNLHRLVFVHAVSSRTSTSANARTPERADPCSRRATRPPRPCRRLFRARPFPHEHSVRPDTPQPPPQSPPLVLRPAPSLDSPLPRVDLSQPSALSRPRLPAST